MEDLRKLYGRTVTEFFGRVNYLSSEFGDKFRRSTEGARLFSAPGRAEIVGNHTDHNRGKVLVGAISSDILAFAEPADTGAVEIVSQGFKPIRVELNSLTPVPSEQGTPAALVRGVLKKMTEEGYPVGGVRAAMNSTLIRGAGMSSSAAFSVLVAVMVNAFYGGKTLAPENAARIAQYAENIYFGKPCGLADQMAIALGGMNKVDFVEPENPACMNVPVPVGYSLVLTHTGGSHAALTSHYAAIREEMASVAAFFGKKYLREIAADQVYAEAPALRKKVGDRAIVRALHFFEENRRVDRAAEALVRADMMAFLSAVRASGESSLKYLQNCYVPGGDEQPITLALKLSEKYIKDGAFRIMGGGFSGAVLAFVREEQEEAYIKNMGRTFGAENVFVADIRSIGATELNT